MMIQPMGEVDEARMAPRHAGDDPERKLLCAIIGMAKQDLRAKEHREREDARRFFESAHFAEMCGYLDLNAEYLRALALDAA